MVSFFFAKIENPPPPRGNFFYNVKTPFSEQGNTFHDAKNHSSIANNLFSQGKFFSNAKTSSKMGETPLPSPHNKPPTSILIFTPSRGGGSGGVVMKNPVRCDP